jgi:hypothetical protein
MLCANGETKTIDGVQFFICSLNGGVCPFSRWCLVDYVFKMKWNYMECSNYCDYKILVIPQS